MPHPRPSSPILASLRPLAPRRPLLGGSLALLALVSGCTGPGPGKGHASAALIPLASCDDALAFVREVALQKMNKAIDEELARFEKGEGCYYGWAEGDALGGIAPPSPSAPTSGSPTSGGGGARSTSSSGTNNQVAGVDEADFVKNDGKYIYLAQNGVFRIVDGWPAQSAHQVAKVQLDGVPKKLFVEGDRALVYVSVPDPRLGEVGANGSRPYGGGRECTYGYDCSFAGDGTATKLEIFDIADRAHPIKVRELFLSGSLIAARRIGKTTHTVVTDNLQLFPEVVSYVSENLCDYAQGSYSYSPTPVSPPPAAVLKAHLAYEALREKNRQLILGKDLADALPRLADSAGGAGVLGASEQLCQGLYRAQLLDGASFTTVVSVALDDNAPARTASIVSSPGAVYASDASLYMAVPSEQGHGGGWYGGYESTKQLSAIHKFSISAHVADTGYVGSGLVKGRVLNQFAMDEKDQLLRVATTTGHVPSPDVESQLTILAGDEESGDLSQMGIIEHIAPTEDIRSVRFDGERGFVVTFKKTDPLYVLDLSNPSLPKIDGELKIPGFSTYIHLLDATHLLSIGYDADDHDSFAYFNGVLLQIFDVSDPHNPTLTHRHEIGTRGSSSEALTNHLAFNYFAPLKLLAVPMTICEGGGDGSFGDQLTFSGLMLFDIDAQTGIKEHGRVASPLPAQGSYGADASCSSWWSNAGSEVKRSIFMDRMVYAISDARLQVASVDATSSLLQSIDLEPLSTP